MASVLYPSGIDAIGTNDIDLVTSDIRAVLIENTYTYSAAHDFLDDIPSGDRTATPVALTNKTFTGGVFDADDVTFPAASVTASVTSNAIVLFIHTGVDATARLLAYIDTASSGLPVTTGSPAPDVEVAWSSGANKIFKIG